MTGLAIAVLSAAIWAYLALGRGGFWRGLQDDRAMHDGLPHARQRLVRWPRVVAVIPARDEAELVGVTVASLLGQRYDGALSVIVVDDHSGDATAEVARRAAEALGCPGRLQVVAAPTLPAGWKGKMWAVANGVARAEAEVEPPDFLLLTDADIRYEPDAVAALVSFALDNRLVLSSLMVRLRCQSFAERLLIPAFVFFFQMLYPFAWINQQRRRTAAAAGGCMLVAPTALRAAGGIASIRDALIDDCALARRLKPLGPIAIALGDHVESMRAYPAFDDIRRMVVRSAYAQLGHAAWRLVLVVAAMLLVFVAPVVLAVAGDGWTRWLGLGTWVVMAVLFRPTVKRYDVAIGWCVAVPLIAAIYLAFTIESAVLHALGRGGRWKGRVNASTVEAP